jgi:hypothetical protein
MEAPVIPFLLALAVTLVVTTLGHRYARELVSRKLRYVPAAQTSKAPIIAGVGATILALPLVAILPLVGLGTAICFGLAVGIGAAAGARDVKGRLGGF